MYAVPPPPSDSQAPALAPERIVYEEQMRLILAHTDVGALVATLFALILALSALQGGLGAPLPTDVVLTWMAVKVGVVLPRLLHARWCRSLPPGLRTEAYRFTVPLLALDGLVWGLGGLYVTHFSASVATTVAALLCCVACVATFGLQVRATAAMAYVAPMLGPVSFGLLQRNDTVGAVGGVGLMLFLGLLLNTSRLWQGRMREVFELRLATERIAGERADALRLAERHSQAKNHLLAVVSHELRTPLHGILGLSHLTRRELPREHLTQHYRLELIEEAAEHLQRLVSDLLDISAIEAGRLQLHETRFDLRHELQALQETWQLRARETGLGLAVEVDDSCGSHAIGDATRVVQVLTNLLGNAFKFTPMGGHVALAVHRLPEDPECVQFSVSDTGPGIAAEDRERIFNSFEQATTAAGGRPGGVGLGLTIARRLALAMQGELRCDSEPGHGSVFHFVARLPAVDAPPLGETEAAPWRRARVGTGRVVAIADDDSSSNLLATTAARTLGCEVEEYAEGRALLKRLLGKGRPLDVLVLDGQMPGASGLECLRALREREQREQRPRLPVIFVSANALPTVEPQARAAGADDYLAKPFSPRDLEALIEQHLKATPAGGAIGSSARKTPLSSVITQVVGPAMPPPLVQALMPTVLQPGARALPAA